MQQSTNDPKFEGLNPGATGIGRKLRKDKKIIKLAMEEHALKNVNNCLNANIYSYLETSGGQSSNPYLNVVHSLNTRAD